MRKRNLRILENDLDFHSLWFIICMERQETRPEMKESKDMSSENKAAYVDETAEDARINAMVAAHVARLDREAAQIGVCPLCGDPWCIGSEADREQR